MPKKMDDFDSFAQAIQRLRGKTRDPLSTRVASVMAAIVDVSEGEITAGKVYASAISTLEGILLQSADDADSLLDSLYTQAALLKVLTVVVRHVAPSTLQATAVLTSRVLRALVSSTISLLADDENNAEMIDTKDGLGATNMVLQGTCDVTTEVLRQLPHNTDDATVRKLLNETLMTLLQDSSRPRTQTAAKESLSGLLLQKSPQCHPVILKSTTKFADAMIDRFLKHPSQQGANQSMIELMGFLNPALAVMDFTHIGGRIMTILIDLMNQESLLSSPSRPVFAAKSRATTLHILTINSILSAILSLLEGLEQEGEVSVMQNDTSNKLDAFAARVLASLVQVKSTLVFREGVAEHDLLESGRLIYGQVMLSASQRLLNNQVHVQVAAKLLPLVFQHVFGLSRPIGEDRETSAGESLFTEVSQLIRTNLLSLKEANPSMHEKCTNECLEVFAYIVRSPFDPVYARALQPFALLLQQMPSDNNAVKESILTLVTLRSDPEVGDQVRAFVDGALVSLVEGIGVEYFWTAIRFNKLLCVRESKASVFHKYSWLFDIMKGSMVGKNRTLLAFFQNEVLPLVRNFDVMASKGGTSSVMFRSLVVNLWSLFPVFCRFPSDIQETFPNSAPTLMKAMNDERYPELIIIICNGFDELFGGVLKRKSNYQELIEGDEAETTKMDAEVLGAVSAKLLPSLFKLVDTLHERCGTREGSDAMDTDALEGNDESSKITMVTGCIAVVARLAPKELVRHLFSRVLQRILQTSQDRDDKSILKLCSLLSLAQSLVVSESLEDSSIELLFRALKPLIRTDETPAKVQKRAYKLLCDICKKYHSFIADASRLKEVTALLSNTSATSQIAARFMRLKCLTIVVEGFDGSGKGSDSQDLSTSLVGETLLCLKDSNAKTRDAAYKLLLAVCRLHGDSSSFIQVVAAAIGSNTPHMRSAAVTGLARLAFEFSKEDVGVQSMMPALLKTVLILSDDPSREVTKSMVLFVRVAVSACTPAQIEPLLPDILGGLLKYHRGKDRFRSKIKIIIKKLVKMFGYDSLMPFVPTSDAGLLTHMRKLDEREARRKKSSAYRLPEDTVGYDVMEDSDGEQDSDDGLTLVTGMTRKSRLTRVTNKTKRTLETRHSDAKSLVLSTKSCKGNVSVRIKNDADGDILDVRELKTVTFADAEDSDDDTSDGDIEFDASGKLVIRDVDDGPSMGTSAGAGMLDLLTRNCSTPNQKGANSIVGRGDRKNEGKKKPMARPGQAYKAKKAGGDTKKKGQKYEPYAYMQLDGRSYTRKNRRQAVEQMGSIVERGRKRQRR